MRAMAWIRQGLEDKYSTHPQNYFGCVYASLFFLEITIVTLRQPYYGQAIAQCLVSEYLLKYFPYEDFNLYEIGAGNGTLASDILSFIQERYPEVYDRTHYTIVEISESLVKQQRKKLHQHSCAKIVHKSIFHWDVREPAPCFMIALEVVVSDN